MGPLSLSLTDHSRPEVALNKEHPGSLQGFLVTRKCLLRDIKAKKLDLLDETNNRLSLTPRNFAEVSMNHFEYRWRLSTNFSLTYSERIRNYWSLGGAI